MKKSNYLANSFCYAFEGLIHSKNRHKLNKFDKDWTILSPFLQRNRSKSLRLPIHGIVTKKNDS